MAHFAAPPLSRDQLVLFPERLDQAIPADHSVRLVDDILGRLDWTQWEQRYHGRIGQPPIHPRVIASVILYGNSLPNSKLSLARRSPRRSQ